MNALPPVYVHHALRTPRGAAKPDGALAGTKPVTLVAALLEALRDRGVSAREADDFVLGCNTQTGDQGANLAQTALLYTDMVPGPAGATLNRFCCSGLDAIRYGVAQVASGMSEVVLAGGVESMSRVPMFSDKGAWFADPEVAVRTRFVHMGVAADLLATRQGIAREDCDAFALRSQQRAARAEADGHFVSRIAVSGLDREECIRAKTTAEKLAAMPLAFDDPRSLGAAPKLAASAYELDAITSVHTVATSPAMCDAASLVVLAGPNAEGRIGGPPRARIRGIASLSGDPLVMLEAPAKAVRRACAHAGVAACDLDVVECNESFAATAIYAQRELGIDDEAFNPNGGATAMGHPLGATGGILLGTLLDELERRDATLGAVTIPAGGGIAMALVVERV